MQSMNHAGELSVSEDDDNNTGETGNGTLQLLLAWRNFILVLAACKVCSQRHAMYI